MAVPEPPVRRPGDERGAMMQCVTEWADRFDRDEYVMLPGVLSADEEEFR